MALLATFATFITVILFTWLILGGNKDSAVKTRLERLQDRETIYGNEEPMDKPLWERLLQPVLSKLDSGVKRVAPASILQHMDEELVKAGRPWNLTASQFMIMRLLVGFGLPILLIILMGNKINLLFVIGVFGIGLIFPRFFLKRAVKQRQYFINRELPNALDLLTVSVEAGLGFDGAILKLVEKTKGPLTQEFRRMLQEIRIGKSRRDALRELSERAGTEDLQTFVSALIQADQLGVSIGRVLRIQSQQMRLKRRQQAEERAMKAPVKMLIPMIIFIFPTLFIVLLGPGALQFIDQAKNMGMQ
ncbi:MAG TPA: type II secretion system F family protein [Bacillota bacterium]|nr:type II secretion system F family protein [Bacillota bacterium]